jgi:hypothetical protein
MTVAIGILGWGSLLWEGGSEFDKRHALWRFDGPTLKIEFSRISTGRQGALTLVIDEQNGSSTTVAWCLSLRHSVEDAICDLRCRESTTVENIGYVRGSREPDCPVPQDVITNWAREKNLDAVIWTALKSNFEKRTGTPFSVDVAVAYIKTLDRCGKAKAVEYIWRAPKFVKTPVRSALEQEPWFADTNREAEASAPINSPDAGRDSCQTQK